MNALKKLKRESTGYFEELAKGTQELVKELILEAANDRGGPEGWKQDDDCIDDIECHSRDGFWAFDHNRGGLCYRNFTDLMQYWGSGYGLAHKAANAALHKQIDQALKDCSESVYENHKPLCLALNISEENCDYRSLDEFERTSELLTPEQREELKSMVREVQDTEMDHLGGDYASVMHELRVMYHGKGDGLHSASVSAAVNLEGPYHRSHIPWAPNVFCEGAKEVEITWRTQAELKRKLAKALSQVSKEVF